MKFQLRTLMASLLLITSSIALPTKAVDIDIYNTLSQPVATFGSYNDDTWFAISFKTTSAAYNITKVVVPINNANNLTTGQANVSIWTNNGVNQPGTQVGSALGSIALSSVPAVAATSYGSYMNWTISNISKILTPNTNYYLVVGGSGIGGTGSARAFQVKAMTNMTGANITGSLGQSQSSTTGASWNGPLVNFYFGGQISAIPEPSTYALAAIASGVMAFIARRRKTNRARA